MTEKSCSQCRRLADGSLCFLLSTLGITPRQQKCTRSVSLCAHCMRDLIARLGTVCPPDLVEPLTRAYRAVYTPSNHDPDPQGKR